MSAVLLQGAGTENDLWKGLLSHELSDYFRSNVSGFPLNLAVGKTIFQSPAVFWAASSPSISSLHKFNPELVLAQNTRWVDDCRIEEWRTDQSQSQSVEAELAFALGGASVAQKTASWILTKKFSAEAVYNFCDAVGRFSDDRARASALVFLSALLTSSDAEIRDAAVLGMALLNDAKSLPALEGALKRETNRTVRETIQSLVVDLSEK